EMLHGGSLRMNLDRVDLHLRPQSFFQTNTTVAIGLYDQVAEWVDAMEASSLWDLYCGVGGFALRGARPGGHGADDEDRRVRRVTGVEVSEQAIESAKTSAAELGLVAQFLAGDATECAEAGLNAVATGAERPDCVIVNPPRRG